MSAVKNCFIQDFFEPFLSKPENRIYSVSGVDIDLLLNEKVFAPSVGKAIMDKTIIFPNEKVLDIGTGSGIIAIAAAKKGALAFATDTDADAVELTRVNALRNNVKVDVKQGDYFFPFSKKFDVIIANVPQEILPFVVSSKLTKKRKSQICGGKQGNKHILEVLRQAKGFMHNKSRLYLAVYSLTDFFTSLSEAVKNYDVKLIGLEKAHLKKYAQDNIDFFITLTKEGKSFVFEEDGCWKGYMFFLELRKKG